MHSIKLVLIVGLFMCLVKPFAGFDLCNRCLTNKNSESILVKSFTKRLQEYADDSEYDIVNVQRNLANPLLVVAFLFSFILDTLLLAIFSLGGNITHQTLNNLRLSIYVPQPVYLLSGKLTI